MKLTMAKDEMNRKNKKDAEGNGLTHPKHTSVGAINEKTFGAKAGMNEDE